MSELHFPLGFAHVSGAIEALDSSGSEEPRLALRLEPRRMLQECKLQAREHVRDLRNIKQLPERTVADLLCKSRDVRQTTSQERTAVVPKCQVEFQPPCSPALDFFCGTSSRHSIQLLPIPLNCAHSLPACIVGRGQAVVGCSKRWVLHGSAA